MINDDFIIVYTNSDLSYYSVCEILDDTCDDFEYDYEAKCAYVRYKNFNTAKETYSKIIDLITDIETLERIYQEL